MRDPHPEEASITITDSLGQGLISDGLLPVFM